MKTPNLHGRITCLLAGVSLLGTMVGACNRQPNPSATEAPMVAPPAAALPMATSTPGPVGLAPEASALPPPVTRVAYAPAPQRQRYAYIDRAYSMRQAFADTPPDYAVDYQGTRPWIWRARNGAYRIVERLPQGERDYYYEPGEEYPFLVQDPQYSYAYDSGGLAAVYGPEGAELPDELAARRADEAARYWDRSRQLYRAAQYEQRQSAYADEWERRRDNLRAQDAMWQREQARNTDWRSWHEAHAAEEQQRWRQERDQRAAYAAAIGIAVASATGTAKAGPNGTELARRQAGYFSNWQASHGQGSTALAPSKAPTTQPSPTPQKSAVPPQIATAQQQQAADLQAKAAEAKAAEAKAAEAKAAQAGVAETKAAQLQRHETAVAQANSVQAQHAQQLAAQAKQRQADAAQAKAAQAQHAQQLAAEAKQREAAAAQAKAADAKAAEAKAAEAKAAEAKAAREKAAEAQRAEKTAAQLKQREAAAAQAKAAEAKAAQARADQAKAAEAKAAQAKAAEAKATQVKAVEAKAAEAKAAQAKAAEAQHARQAPQADKTKPKPSDKEPPGAEKKRGPLKDRQSDQPQ